LINSLVGSKGKFNIYNLFYQSMVF
jgi:hypothetical protein